MKLTTRLFCIRIVSLLICFFSTTAIYGQNNDFQHKKDSLLKVIASTQGEEKLEAYKQLGNVEFPNEKIDLRLQYINDFIQEARKQKNIKYESVAYYNELSYLYNYLKNDEFERKANEYLPFFKKNGFQENYYTIYSSLLLIHSLNGNNKRTIERTKQMYAEAKQENCFFGIVQASSLIARIYLTEYRYEESEKYFKQTIKNAAKLIEEKPGQSSYHQLIFDGYVGLSSALDFQEKTDELFSLMLDWKKQLTFFEKTFGYPEHLQNYYMSYAELYIKKGKCDEAELYCDSIELTTYNPINWGYIYIIKSGICEIRNEYDKAIDYIDKSINHAANSGELEEMTILLRQKSHILSKMGRAKEVYSNLNRVILLNDSIRLLENNAQLDAIRTEYEIDKHIAEKERNFNYLLFAIGGCILLAIALGIWIYLNRKITKKNRILSQQISDWATQQEVQVNEMLDKTSFMPVETLRATSLQSADLCVENQMDKLCIAIRDLLLKDKIYQDPTITQEIMVRQLGTNKNRFSKAVEYCFNMPFKDYVNFLRLKDAVQLLEQSDMPILEISDKVGFGSERSFFRIFSEKYGITPNNYRNSRRITS